MQDRTERPIAYVSHTLSLSEKNYSHLENEGLAILYFGDKSFTIICMKDNLLLCLRQAIILPVQ